MEGLGRRGGAVLCHVVCSRAYQGLQRLSFKYLHLREGVQALVKEKRETREGLRAESEESVLGSQELAEGHRRKEAYLITFLIGHMFTERWRYSVPRGRPRVRSVTSVATSCCSKAARVSVSLSATSSF